MNKLIRSGPFVDMQIQDSFGGFLCRFDTHYGGAPLHWYRWDGGKPTQIVSPHAGEGASIVWDSGQDATQAGATGVDPFPIQTLESPNDYLSYHCRETKFEPGNSHVLPTYQLEGTCPYFWTSQEYIDDSIPKDPRSQDGKQRWSLLYQDILNLGANVYNGFGCPIFFAPNANCPSGILFAGDEIRETYYPGTIWSNKLAQIPKGTFSFPMRISLKEASADSFGGMLLRKNVNVVGGAGTIHDAYNATGIHLLVNKQGKIDFWRNGKLVWSYQASASLFNSDAGGLLEVRNFGPILRVYLEKAEIGVIPDSLTGENFGLFAQGSSGRLRFSHRELFDMGTKFIASYQATATNALRMSLVVQHANGTAHIPMYRLAMPGIFIHPNVQDTFWIWDQDKIKRGPEWIAQQPNGVILANRITAMWSGSADGRYGVFCRLRGVDGNGGHVLLNKQVMVINPLNYVANHYKELMSQRSVVADFSPSVREDLL